MSNSKFISALNVQINDLVKAYPGGRVLGLAQGIIRVESNGDLQLIPAEVDKEGEGKYIGLDDSAPVTLYHKANSIQITEKSNSGYGDARALTVNTYNNSMIVFLDRKTTGLLPDEFISLLQANLADAIEMKPYKSVIVRLQNIILNSQQVFASEYQNFEYKIPPRFSLFAINYQIESTFDRKCFATCP